PILGRPGMRRGPQLSIGMEGMFFLTKHHSEKDLYLVQDVTDVLQRDNNPDFDKEVKTAKRVVELAGNALANLKSDNAQDRFDKAAILIPKSRDTRFAPGKTEAIPAEESKLILKALLEGNWNQAPRQGAPGPLDLFMQLGLTEKDGWKVTPKANLERLHETA